MANNENRSIFSIHGITGMLIATALLLTILAVLITFSIKVQQAEAQNFYEIQNPSDIQMNSTSNANHYKLK